MSLTDEQVKLFSSELLVSDIIDYINTHSKEYEQFLKEDNLGKEINNYDNRRTKRTKAMDKLEKTNN